MSVDPLMSHPLASQEIMLRLQWWQLLYTYYSAWQVI